MMLFKNLNFANFFGNKRVFKRISHKIFKIFKHENDKAVGNVVWTTVDFILSIIASILKEKDK